MGEPEVALGEAELLRIRDYVKGNLKAWLTEVAPSVFTPDPVTNTQLLERIVRLDERFEHVNTRFETIDKRFEAMDRRFDDLIHAMDKKFEAVDKRFEDLIHHIDKRFEAVDKRFEAVDKRFGTVQWVIVTCIAAATVAATLLTIFFG